MLVPLAMRTADDQLRLGRVHSIGELGDPELQAKIPFHPGDRVCWIEGRGEVHVLNETLLLVALNTRAGVRATRRHRLGQRGQNVKNDQAAHQS